MSYSLFSKDKHIDHLASVVGMNDLLDFVLRTVKSGPLLDFINKGETSDIQGTIRDIDTYLPYATNSEVKDILLNLKTGLGQIKGTAIISD
jgi:hypothetical protein